MEPFGSFHSIWSGLVQIITSIFASFSEPCNLPTLNKILYPVITRRVQESIASGNWESITLKSDGMGGKGVFATEEIEQGTIICHYGGELLDVAQFTHDMSCGRTKFLLEVQIGENKIFFNHTDSTQKTFGCMMNHSSLHPNCAKKIHQDQNGCPVVVLKALQKIQVDEELVHDYGKKYEDLPPCTVNCRQCTFAGELFFFAQDKYLFINVTVIDNKFIIHS